MHEDEKNVPKVLVREFKFSIVTAFKPTESIRGSGVNLYDLSWEKVKSTHKINKFVLSTKQYPISQSLIPKYMNDRCSVCNKYKALFWAENKDDLHTFPYKICSDHVQLPDEHNKTMYRTRIPSNTPPSSTEVNVDGNVFVDEEGEPDFATVCGYCGVEDY